MSWASGRMGVVESVPEPRGGGAYLMRELLLNEERLCG